VYSGNGISKFSNCSFVDPVNPSLHVVCPSAKYVINYAGRINVKRRCVLITYSLYSFNLFCNV
jgi:hypothetical protein